MCQKSAATTWGLDLSIYEKIGYEGFSAFRIVQIDMNSGGTHNMCLSNIELYGKPSNPEAWAFWRQKKNTIEFNKLNLDLIVV